jgi:hypothetical protein
MSFDPKKSNFDKDYPQGQDPQWDQFDEQDLPDDLAHLAAQLSEDADRLATSYPAAQSEVWLASAAADASDEKIAASWHRWVRIAAAVAAVSLTAGTGAWIVSSRTPSPDNTAQFHPPVVSEPQPLHSAQLQEALASPTEVTPMDSPVVPAGFFQTLSGPEQEAMLDLMEEEGLDQASLSI